MFLRSLWEMEMGGLNIWHWLIFMIFFLGTVIPVSIILRKAGFSRWLSILFFFPVINLVALWVFACSTWPKISNNNV